MIKEYKCPNELRSIEKCAFSNCIQLTKFEFNDKIEAINSCTFFNTSLKKIKIPNIITDIIPDSFLCSNDIQFEFEEGGHPFYDAINNLFIEKDTKVLLFTYGKISGTYRVPDNIVFMDMQTIYSDRFVTHDGIAIKKGLTKLIVPESYQDQFVVYDYNSLDSTPIYKDLYAKFYTLCSDAAPKIEIPWQRADNINYFATDKFIPGFADHYFTVNSCNDNNDRIQKDIVFEAKDGNYPKGLKYTGDIYQQGEYYILEYEIQKTNFVRYLQTKLDSKVLNGIHGNLIIYLLSLITVLSVIIVMLSVIYFIQLRTDINYI
ncbi:hypothetical protein TVAG_372330 [Trichomonas vaginalis G3]|uniref:Surface antigen BspA-like n=1 Tax=Trichomonas vaginalis (strain ATCC PRA-98 / G3) TaxID=412133 RepID=A2FZZ9_TRIV3|nr:ribonuclease inhibitor domain-containing protein [Trichomonas vaginalis G3]EAX89521.1 hypothetical protein TVAG_372330 [Trichomonas vaginalis G3]KAI5493352.1 ribonuclease inhibitor domain-containing protein [Trichomonas vaginalis G3]|eukprot:XP_001302451.1 hypothetical protein [Trichomonas vaginalis G3]